MLTWLRRRLAAEIRTVLADLEAERAAAAREAARVQLADLDVARAARHRQATGEIPAVDPARAVPPIQANPRWTDDPPLTVNGKPVTFEEFPEAWRRHFGSKPAPATTGRIRLANIRRIQDIRARITAEKKNEQKPT